VGYENYFIWLNTKTPYVWIKLSKMHINIHRALHCLDDDFQFFLLNAFEKTIAPLKKYVSKSLKNHAPSLKMNDCYCVLSNNLGRLGCTFRARRLWQVLF